MTSGTSELWQNLTESLFSTVDEAFIASFRRPGGANYRFAAWDPFDRTMRYFKFLLFKTAIQKPERFFECYRGLNGTEIGDPVFVTVRGCKIDMDYLFAVEEFLFISKNMDIAELESVVEIGAGFGRTCHAFLALAPQIKSYTIVDLAPVLSLSRAVLSKVVPEHFSKIRFIDAKDVDQWRGLRADMMINIDSFQEMSPDTINGYLKGIGEFCQRVYIKNPIGKYNPECVGIHVDDPAKFHDVFSLGLCRDVIEIFDEDSLDAARKAYVEAYLPNGKTLLAQEPLDMFPYLCHALYETAK